MTSRNIVGWSILTLFAGAIFGVTVVAVGFRGAVAIWAGAAIAVAVMAYAIDLTLE